MSNGEWNVSDLGSSIRTHADRIRETIQALSVYDVDGEIPEATHRHRMDDLERELELLGDSVKALPDAYFRLKTMIDEVYRPRFECMRKHIKEG